jgi:hypothetical protein
MLFRLHEIHPAGNRRGFESGQSRLDATKSKLDISGPRPAWFASAPLRICFFKSSGSNTRHAETRLLRDGIRTISLVGCLACASPLLRCA